MEKKLFTQIRNEWHSNLWLALELLVVSVVMWYIIDLLYSRIATYMEPRGFNTEHCYLIEMGVLTDKSPDFTPYSDTHKQSDEVRELVERLRHRPEVEAVSLSQNSYPYNGSNSGLDVMYDTLHAPSWTIRRLATPDFCRVFQYRGTRGETPEQLAELLERGDFLASDNLYRHYQISMTSLVGKKAFRFNWSSPDDSTEYRLGAALQNVRYSDYEQGRFCYSMLYNLNLIGEGWINADNELCVRVRAEHDKNYQQSYANELRNYIGGMGVLLLNIFLGLLGTFWFRTQQRHSEIALHKALGATNGDVFRRLMAEGLFLLILVTVPAIIIDIVLAQNELNAWHNGTTLEWNRLLLCASATFVLIALMIGIGIGIPARRAMKVQPAEALHDE